MRRALPIAGGVGPRFDCGEARPAPLAVARRRRREGRRKKVKPRGRALVLWLEPMANRSIRRTTSPVLRSPRPRLGAGLAALACAATLAATGCSKKEEDVKLAPVASSLAESKAPPTSMVAKYAIDPKGKTTIDMPAPKEHIKAETTASGGSLDVDLMNLANTRGEVKIDMSTITTHTFDDPKQDGTQTEHARNWLEVGTLVTPEEREKNRWALYAIRSIDGLSAADVTKIAPTKDGEGDVRTVTLTAHGEFLLHGRKVDKEAPLEVALHYPSGAAATSTPSSVVVKTKAPFHITLAEHDVKPRDNFGKLAQGSLSILGTKVANVADVSFELRATSP